MLLPQICLLLFPLSFLCRVAAIESAAVGFRHHHKVTTPPMTYYYRNFGAGGRGELNLVGGMISSPGVSHCSMDSPLSAALKHDTGLSVEWSIGEQCRLEEGLARYANEPNIMKYVKIAASMSEKTARDVALRCKWMARKRRKQEDRNCGKKGKDRKELLAGWSLKNSVPSSGSPLDVLTASSHERSDSMLSGEAAISGAAKHLLEENNEALCQISSNLSVLKLQQNIDLFLQTKQNLSKILADMSKMAGIMRRMPPLPVLLNEELTNTILSQGRV